MVASVAAMDGPTADEWWMACVCDRETGESIAELSVGMSWGMRTAEVGYTLSHAHWGKGYAVEATSALIEYLFNTVAVTRVFGMLDPRNPASAMVLERCGLVFEGETKASFWLMDEVSDDWIYGMDRGGWNAWRMRRTDSPVDVALVEITPDNRRQVAALTTHKTQERFVAPVIQSYADAQFSGARNGESVEPWMRAVVADGDFVGFVMVLFRSGAEPVLWRLLIDRMHQRRGIGRRVIDSVVDECRHRGASILSTSWTEGKGSPGPMYERYGFVRTGSKVGDEVEARLVLN